MSEDVYFAQLQLQESVLELFEALDRAQGTATGVLLKSDVRVALASFFKVGQADGKTPARFDELMKSLDEDQPGESVVWAKVFEEDREFNQGEFAEAIRDQALQERIEFLATLEAALIQEAGDGESCTQAQVARALMAMDSQLSYGAAAAMAASFWGASSAPTISIKLAMKRVRRRLAEILLCGRAVSTTISESGTYKQDADAVCSITSRASACTIDPLPSPTLCTFVAHHLPAHAPSTQIARGVVKKGRRRTRNLSSRMGSSIMGPKQLNKAQPTRQKLAGPSADVTRAVEALRQGWLAKLQR